MKTTTLPLRNLMNRSPLRFGFLLNALALAVAWLAPSQLANAQCPQICDDNNNTALGDNALISNTTGSANTAFGFYALLLNTTGYDNTAVGADALRFNTTGNDNTAIGLNTLQYESAGMGNTAIGAWALDMSTGGD